MAILPMVIDRYWCLLMIIILMVIGGYSIGAYWWLLIGHFWVQVR
jgi:hypothetical protein